MKEPTMREETRKVVFGLWAQAQADKDRRPCTVCYASHKGNIVVKYYQRIRAVDNCFGCGARLDSAYTKEVSPESGEVITRPTKYCSSWCRHREGRER